MLAEKGWVHGKLILKIWEKEGRKRTVQETNGIAKVVGADGEANVLLIEGVKDSLGFIKKPAVRGRNEANTDKKIQLKLD